MPGTRTAPTVDGLPTFKVVSITMYDYTGDQRTETIQVDAAATDAQIEAYVAALQAATNATVWKVDVGYVYNSVGDSSNALEEVWENAATNIVTLIKDADNNSRNAFIPAPINAVFLEGTENINPSATQLADYLTALLALRSGFSVVSMRFTHRKQIGSVVRI